MHVPPFGGRGLQPIPLRRTQQNCPVRSCSVLRSSRRGPRGSCCLLGWCTKINKTNKHGTLAAPERKRAAQTTCTPKHFLPVVTFARSQWSCGVVAIKKVPKPTGGAAAATEVATPV